MKYFFSWYITNNRDYRFESFDYAKLNGFKASDYELALQGEIEGEDKMDALENLFVKMNSSQSNHPGVRSMSVSDVVLLEEEFEPLLACYCDDIGWTPLDFWNDL